MGLKHWSTTAGDNDDADADINWLENQAPSTVNNSARAMMAKVREWYEDYEWRDLGHTPTRTGNTTFTVTSDKTATYTAGRAIRCTDSSTLYGFITASSFSSVTTVTVALASGNLSASLTAVLLGPEVTNRAISPFAVRWNKGADVASASALTLPKDGNYFDITGTTAITSITTLGVTGLPIKLHFDGALTLTHHATDLYLPGGANITTAAGDEAEFIEYASGDWRCTSYSRASGLPIISGAASGASLVLLASGVASNSAAIDFDGYFSALYDVYFIKVIGWRPATDNSQMLLQAMIAGTAQTASHQFAARRSIAAGGSTDAVSASDSGIRITGDTSNGATTIAQAEITIFHPLDTAAYKKVLFKSIYNANITIQDGGGIWNDGSTLTAWSGVRLKQDTGNITSGAAYLYGLKKA